MVFRLVLASILSFLSIVSVADAQSEADTEAARVAFERGRTAYEAGAFDEALEAFQRAYALTENPEILYNVATVADRLRRDQLALEAYQGYLAGRPDASDRGNVEARIRALQASLDARARTIETDEADQSDETDQTDETNADSHPDAPSGVAPRTEAAASNEPGLALVITGAVLALGGAALLIASAVETDAASRATTWAELMGPYERVPLLSAVGVLALSLGGAMAAIGTGWLILAGNRGDQEIALRVGPTSLSLSGSF